MSCFGTICPLMCTENAVKVCLKKSFFVLLALACLSTGGRVAENLQLKP